ncbi:MAG TPA: MliC family protein [bacterium]|nr:MliC family protein [bacterium]HPO51670.1 MliC family protein [bacterium]
MKKLTIWKCLVMMIPAMFIAGCAGLQTKGNIKVWYVREDGKKMHVTFVKNPAQAILNLGKGNVLHLKQVVSGSGSRYSDGKTEFWIKGDQATLTISGKVIKCWVENNH